MSFATLVRISRPRFWHYVLWPMLIFFASSNYVERIQESFSRGWTDRIFYTLFIIIVLWYFTLPANLWIYGRNDIADGDTDKFNDKKGKYEVKMEDTEIMKRKLKKSIWMWNVGYLLAAYFITYLWGMTADCFPWAVNNYMCATIIETPWILLQGSVILFFYSHLWLILWYLGVFLLSSYLYSCQPLRAKAKPFLDGIMNILYVATPFSIIIWFIIISGPISSYTREWILPLLFAAWCWVMAMHCYSAIPDIEPDKQAWLVTTAVYLGKQKSLLYCWLLYLLSAILSFWVLWWFSVGAWVIYLTMIVVSYYRKDIFWLYKLFPYINLLIWFLLFRYIVLYLS